MRELFIYYIWQLQYFNKANLATADGEPIEIFNPGTRNTDSGPDFYGSRIRIGAMEWVGSVEIHINASDWLRHAHSDDPAYENVVLHVVWKNDKSIMRTDGTPLPVLELQNRVDETLILKYQRLMNSPEEIPCSRSFGRVSQLIITSMGERTLVTRLEAKAAMMRQVLERNGNNWEETCYQLLCRNFGFKVNADPLQQLGQSMPHRLLMKHRDSLLQVEALLFGQAGLLDRPGPDEYQVHLLREYRALQQKYSLHDKKMNEAQWRFLRLRPSNFPTVRIAQLAALIQATPNLFSQVIEAPTYAALKSIFAVKHSGYWSAHYQFSRVAKRAVPDMGEISIQNIIINTVAPLLVLYGKSKDDQQYIDNAMTMLQKIPAEQNAITRKWDALGFTCNSAFDSQAMIELYNHFCLRYRCMECTIGASLIRPDTR